MRFLLICLSALLLAATVSSAFKFPKPPKAMPIKNPSDPNMMKVGEKAIEEYNKMYKDPLKFKKLVSGDIKAGSFGKIYHLFIQASNALNVIGTYEADLVDFVHQKKPWGLMVFHQVA